MFSEMNHTPYRDLLPQYAAGTLDEILGRHVAAHLAGCADCRADLAELRAIAGSMRRELAALPPDDTAQQSWAALRARLTPQPVLPKQRSNSVGDNIQPFFDNPIMTTPSTAPRQANRRWRGFASVAAVVLVAVVSLALFGALRHPGINSQPGAANATNCVNATTQDTLPHYTHLLNMSFDSPGDGWATGLKYDDKQRLPFTGVIYHVHNCRWQQFPITLPKIGLSSISMVSADEGWAAGALTKTGHWAIDDLAALVVYHYQHGQWQQVNIPGTQAYVSGEIVMRDDTEGWLIGQGPVNQPNGLLHFQNGTWSPVTLPTQIAGSAIFPLTPVGPNEVWFESEIYTPSNPNSTFTTSLVHDQGGHVTTYPLPSNTEVGGLAFPAPNDGWASGETGIANTTARSEPMLLHFDGKRWTNEPLPTALTSGYGDNYFARLSLTSAQEGFIYGFDNNPTDPAAPLLFYHLHHGKWEVYQMPPNPALKVDSTSGSSGDMHMVSENEGWAFATLPTSVKVGTIFYSAFSTVILHYANGAWSVFEQ